MRAVMYNNSVVNYTCFRLWGFCMPSASHFSFHNPLVVNTILIYERVHSDSIFSSDLFRVFPGRSSRSWWYTRKLPQTLESLPVIYPWESRPIASKLSSKQPKVGIFPRPPPPTRAQKVRVLQPVRSAKMFMVLCYISDLHDQVA